MAIWKRFSYMTLTFQMVLADALVGSVLRYGEELWAWGGGQAIDRIDAKCLCMKKGFDIVKSDLGLKICLFEFHVFSFEICDKIWPGRVVV